MHLLRRFVLWGVAVILFSFDLNRRILRIDWSDSFADENVGEWGLIIFIL